MSGDSTKTTRKPSLSDKDIATRTRRSGPASGAPGTDADAHSDSDTDAHASTDVDTDTNKAATAISDKDPS